MCCRAVSPTLKFSLMYFSMAWNDEPFRFLWATIAAFTISANFGWLAGFLAPVSWFCLCQTFSQVFALLSSTIALMKRYSIAVKSFHFLERTAVGSIFNFQTLFTLCSDIVCACLPGSRPSNFFYFYYT